MKTPSKSKANNPNANYAMYEADRIAKAKAQPKLPSIALHTETKSFPSLLQSAENKRRLQLEDRADWTQDGDPPAFAGESEADYNERTDRYGDRQ